MLVWWIPISPKNCKYTKTLIHIKCNGYSTAIYRSIDKGREG
nr:MAG TPA: hypothetical protein [Caudoviricetes sp.]DAO43269.1 MAG TPA: hypothetical protein [Caudoviricetes sp.]